MSNETKLIRLQVLKLALEQANEELVEAQISTRQRALAYQEQKKDAEFSEIQRCEALQRLEKDTEWEKGMKCPSMCMGTEIFYDESEEKFACQHGQLTAYGDTPAMACENFDHLWVFGYDK